MIDVSIIKKGADVLGKKVEDFASELTANKESENDALNALLAEENVNARKEEEEEEEKWMMIRCSRRFSREVGG